MRLIALILAAFAISGPAAAQNWQEYSYPDYAFTVTFPADPKIESTTLRSPTAVRFRHASTRFAGIKASSR